MLQLAGSLLKRLRNRLRWQANLTVRVRGTRRSPIPAPAGLRQNITGFLGSRLQNHRLFLVGSPWPPLNERAWKAYREIHLVPAEFQHRSRWLKPGRLIPLQRRGMAAHAERNSCRWNGAGQVVVAARFSSP